VHDATAKVPSGIFNGNLNQYGDYDQCLNAVAGNGDFTGKYCIAYLQPKSRNGTMREILKLVQSNEFFKSNFDDVSCELCSKDVMAKEFSLSVRSSNSALLAHQLGGLHTVELQPHRP